MSTQATFSPKEKTEKRLREMGENFSAKEEGKV